MQSGVNVQEDSWKLSLKKARLEDTKTLKDFLDGRAGLPFYWTPPRETLPKLWTCDGKGVNEMTSQAETVQVTYDQWFGGDDS